MKAAAQCPIMHCSADLRHTVGPCRAELWRGVGGWGWGVSSGVGRRGRREKVRDKGGGATVQVALQQEVMNHERVPTLSPPELLHSCFWDQTGST